MSAFSLLANPTLLSLTLIRSTLFLKVTSSYLSIHLSSYPYRVERLRWYLQ